jgi:hypothetical protein
MELAVMDHRLLAALNLVVIGSLWLRCRALKKRVDELERR